MDKYQSNNSKSVPQVVFQCLSVAVRPPLSGESYEKEAAARYGKCECIRVWQATSKGFSVPGESPSSFPADLGPEPLFSVAVCHAFCPHKSHCCTAG